MRCTAEGHTDRHNMLMFLLQDTIRSAPAGFESSRKNIFDPEEEDNEIDGEDSDDSDESSSSEDLSRKAIGSYPSEEKSHSTGSGEDVAESSESQEEESPIDAPSVCSRNGCTKKPRFDSVFCSDGCGVSALESDLLRTFYYSSDIHPSSLRH